MVLKYNTNRVMEKSQCVVMVVLNITVPFCVVVVVRRGGLSERGCCEIRGQKSSNF